MGQEKANFNILTDFTENFGRYSDMYNRLWNQSISNGFKMVEAMSDRMTNMVVANKSDGCCPPERDCPPQCLLNLTRHAYPGERIVVPFAIKNTCGAAKTYRVGVRSLMDQFGEPASATATLDKEQVTLNPGQSITVLMTIDLANEQRTGVSYQTDIVIREAEVNQNICFTLHLNAYADIPVAKPLDERHYLNHFQSWQSHFYCEKPLRDGQTRTDG
jgi:hypothetical protein